MRLVNLFMAPLIMKKVASNYMLYTSLAYLFISCFADLELECSISNVHFVAKGTSLKFKVS